ncbi:unnamed protein product [Caenorhabditis sp. 36 PRJEB53466]|nr:unnamed protein product [Caenorhabditis sp. 36 PRJEB53466]
MPTIPSLTGLAAEKVGELVDNDELPISSAIKLSNKASNQVLAILYDNCGDLNERTWKTIYLSGIFAPSVLDLSGVPIGWSDLAARQNGTYTRFKLGHRHWTEKEEDVVSEAALLFRVLNETSWDHLTSLDWSGRRRLKWYSAATMLSSFPSLTTLNVANQQVPSRALTKIASHCPQLKHLNISETGIQHIGPLEALEHLEVLIMHTLDVKSGVEALQSLRKLRVLDVSASKLAHTIPAMFVAEQSRNGPSPWPELRSIDISGLELPSEAVRAIMRAHPKLGEILTIFDAASVEQRPGLKVLNKIDLLKRYLALDRPAFLLTILESMRNTIELMGPEDRYELFKICMKVSKKFASGDDDFLDISIRLTVILWPYVARTLSDVELHRTVGMLLDVAERFISDYTVLYPIWTVMVYYRLLETYGNPVQVERLALAILLKKNLYGRLLNGGTMVEWWYGGWWTEGKVAALEIVHKMCQQQPDQLDFDERDLMNMLADMDKYLGLPGSEIVRCYLHLFETFANTYTHLRDRLARDGLLFLQNVQYRMYMYPECRQLALRLMLKLITYRCEVQDDGVIMTDELHHELAHVMIHDMYNDDGLTLSYLSVHTLLATFERPNMWESPDSIRTTDQHIIGLLTNYPDIDQMDNFSDEHMRCLERYLEERNFGSRVMFALWNVLMELKTVPSFNDRYEASRVKQLVEEIARGIIELEGSEKIVKMAQSIVTFRDSNPSTYPSSI